jgi:hypothetical protein
MLTRTSLLMAMAMGAALLAGCKQKVESGNLKTSSLAATFRISDDPSGNAAAFAQLMQGDRYLDLNNADGLYCDGIKLAKNDQTLSGIDYQGTVPRRPVGELYLFEFRRPSTGEYLYSYAIAPNPMVITAPTNATTIDPLAPLQLTWDVASPSGIRIEVTGTGMKKGYSSSVADQGSFTIPANSLLCSDELMSCEATLTLSRTVMGNGDTRFQSCKVESISQASVSIKVQM